jgi:putative endonuclease
MKIHQYYCYITTNPTRTVLYVGMTNNLSQRLIEHYLIKTSFAGRYHCFNLIYYEIYKYVYDARAREKTLKGWSRLKKMRLIEANNPDLQFLNDKIIYWPPPLNSAIRTGINQWEAFKH